MATISTRKNRTKKRIDYGKHFVMIVTRSNKNISAQVFDPVTSKIVITVNSNSISEGTKTEKSREVGKRIAARLKEKNIDSIVFNRNGLPYSGRIQALAEAVRSESINI